MPKKPMTPMKLRPNPVRQTILVGLAILGIGIGYGMGYLFKKPSPPMPSITHEQMQNAPMAVDPEPRQDTTPVKDTALVATTVLPESHDGQDKPRAYEEALPREIVQYPPITIPPQVKRPPFLPSTPQVSAPGTIMPSKGMEQRDALSKDETEQLSVVSKQITAPAESLPRWQRNALPIVLSDKPKIAIVIDDMGVDQRRSRLATELAGPLTLSYLTYARNLHKQTQLAKRAGHELMLHVPMEPSSRDIDPGPNVLLSGVPAPEINAALNWGFDQFDGYIGINNHMGSRFTSDLAGMKTVMLALKQRELVFLDSVTSGSTKGHEAAIEEGVPFIARNIFLDHIDNIDEIRNRLEEVKRLAQKQGYAVAIGHPRDATLKALGPWLEAIQNDNFQLVPISALIHLPTTPEPAPQISSTSEVN